MRRLFSDSDTRLYLSGQFLSTFGDSTLWLAAAIWVKTLTGSSAAAGLTFFFMGLPTLIAPVAGLLVDRVRRKPLLIAVNAGTGAMLLSLFWVHGPGQVWLIWTVIAVYGASNVLLGPAQSALLTAIVPSQLLAEANGALQTVSQGLRLVTPLVGAGLFAWLGGAVVGTLDAGTFAVAIVTLLLIRVQEPAPERQPVHLGTQLAGGIRHLWSTTALRQLTLSCAAVMLVLGLFETLVFAVVAQGLHRPPTFVGVAVSTQGVGAVIGAPLAAPVIRRAGELRVGALGILLVALGAALFAVPHLPAVLLASLALGFGIPWVVVAATTLLQRRTPTTLQGRVFSAFDVALGTPQTISVALGAGLVAWVSYQVLCLVAAVVMAGSGLWLLTRRSTARAD